jgi:hypothetical protein
LSFFVITLSGHFDKGTFIYRHQLEEFLEHYDYPDSDSESDDDDDDNESNADNEEEN